MSLNKIMLIGRVGKDPDVRALDGGAKVASFTFATTDKGYTLANGTQVPERTEWHNVIMWNKTADLAERYIHKGDKLYLEGKLRTRSYDKNGVKHYIAEVFVDYMEMLTPKLQQPAASAPIPAPVQQPTSSYQSPAPKPTYQSSSYQQDSVPLPDLPF